MGLYVMSNTMKNKVDECKYKTTNTCRWCEYSAYPELSDGGCRLYLDGIFSNGSSFHLKMKRCEVCGRIFEMVTPYDRACSPECGRKIRKVVKAEYKERLKNRR